MKKGTTEKYNKITLSLQKFVRLLVKYQQAFYTISYLAILIFSFHSFCISPFS